MLELAEGPKGSGDSAPPCCAPLLLQLSPVTLSFFKGEAQLREQSTVVKDFHSGFLHGTSRATDSTSCCIACGPFASWDWFHHGIGVERKQIVEGRHCSWEGLKVSPLVSRSALNFSFE